MIIQLLSLMFNCSMSNCFKKILIITFKLFFLENFNFEHYQSF
jgi:hypothetical protein